MFLQKIGMLTLVSWPNSNSKRYFTDSNTLVMVFFSDPVLNCHLVLLCTVNQLLHCVPEVAVLQLLLK